MGRRILGFLKLVYLTNTVIIVILLSQRRDRLFPLTVMLLLSPVLLVDRYVLSRSYLYIYFHHYYYYDITVITMPIISILPK